MQPLEPNNPNPSEQSPQPFASSSDASQAPLPPPPPTPYDAPPPPSYEAQQPPLPQQSPYQGQPPYPGQQPYGTSPVQMQSADKKMAAGLCGIFLGALGIHKFVLGYNTEGIIMLLVSVIGAWFTCGLSAGAMGVVGIIEGIIYLTKTDQQFVQEYVVNKKPWF